MGYGTGAGDGSGADANGNVTAPSGFIPGFTSTATAAGTTTLTVASDQIQEFTGATTQTVVLPVASTLTQGHSFDIINNSTGIVTVNSSGANLVQTLPPDTMTKIVCIVASGTGAASWDSTLPGNSQPLDGSYKINNTPVVKQNNGSGYIGFNTDSAQAQSRVGGTVVLGSGNLTSIDSTSGKASFDATMTAGGTTGAQTINKPSGSVNFAAAASSLVVTNSLVSTASIVLTIVLTNDTTLKSCAVVTAAGSFTLHANAAATAETKVAFFVIN